MTNTELSGQDGSNPSSVDINFIGTSAPPWLHKSTDAGDSTFHEELDSYDSDGHGAGWVNTIAARSISNRMKGLPYEEKEGYDIESMVPSSIGEVTQLPPEFHETYRDSAAGIDPATGTGHAMTSNCSGRKNVGEVLSDSTEIDGTAGSDRHMQHDLSGVKAYFIFMDNPRSYSVSLYIPRVYN